MDLLHLRQPDFNAVIDSVQRGASCSVIGLSNTGKSLLLRNLAASTENLAQTFVYVDCNLMLAATDQGFYEAVLRSLQETLTARAPDPISPSLLEKLAACYERTIQPASPFLVPLGFNDAIMQVCQALPGGIVLLLDEFDEAYATLDSRVFLNLRALHDKFRGRLAYVTATVKSLRRIRTDPAVEEFCELVTHHERHLGMLSEPDARALIHHLTRETVELDLEEVNYVLRQAGGHPSLTEVVVQLLIQLEGGAPELYRQQGLVLVTQQLDGSELAQTECDKLWHQLPRQEQDELLRFSVEGLAGLSAVALESLQRKGILTRGPQVIFFGKRFAALVRRRRRTKSDYPEGIWIDVDAGDVWVDGEPVPTLTELEYRLLQTLYGRLDKLCDKYLIVESVWGDEYIDKVDDARIEKLISRLRSKVEPDPRQPRYLVTVRGRGYKLAQHPLQKPSSDLRSAYSS